MWDDSDYIDTSDYSGPSTGASAAGLAAPIDASLPGDVSDAQQMAGFNTAPAAAQQAGVPWYAGAVQYGISKAIDNTFPTSPTGVMGNVYPGSIGGTNGQTYTARPTGAGGGVISQAMGVSSFGGLPLPLVLVGAAVVLMLVLKK